MYLRSNNRIFEFSDEDLVISPSLSTLALCELNALLDKPMWIYKIIHLTKAAQVLGRRTD